MSRIEYEFEKEYNSRSPYHLLVIRLMICIPLVIGYRAKGNGIGIGRPTSRRTRRRS